MTDAVLYQLAISHYCEKVRWALDYKKVKYKTVSMLPGFHIRKAKKLTGAAHLPILCIGDTTLNESSDILASLDEQYPENSLMPADESLHADVNQWVAYADTHIGPHVRCVCYHTVLEQKETLLSYFCEHGPWYGKFLYSAIYPKLKLNMRKFMNINADTAGESESAIIEALNKIHTRLASQPFLVGDSFTRADLTVSALLAPLCQPAAYPISWVKPSPEPLNEFQNGVSSRLQFVLDNYHNYRVGGL